MGMHSNHRCKPIANLLGVINEGGFFTPDPDLVISFLMIQVLILMMVLQIIRLYFLILRQFPLMMNITKLSMVKLLQMS